MSSSPWNKDVAAAELDKRMEAELGTIRLLPPQDCFKQLRVYLQRMTDTGRTSNGAHALHQKQNENGDLLINAGPTVFRPPCDDCIRFRSGAQLKFGVTLRASGTGARLLSYSFHLQLLPSSGLQFLRIDLNPRKDAYDPLNQPRSHLHPGFENVHMPFPVMHPLHVLDRIVHVIEPAFAR